MKNYFGFIRDHSMSMTHLRQHALKDYNENINTIKEESCKQSQDTIIYSMAAASGRPAKNEWDVQNSSVATLKPLISYPTDGTSTPLFDAVKEVINTLKNVPDANDPTVAFLVFVTTDGEDNASYISANALGNMIRSLQNTDRWSFVFRVPRGYGKVLEDRLGLHGGNIQEWDQTQRGVAESTAATKSSFTNYFDGRTRGLTSTRSFYTDLSDVSRKDLKQNLIDIRNEVEFLTVTPAFDGEQIRDFVEAHNRKFVKGTAFYQLIKRERAVQDYKQLAVLDKKTKAVYAGAAARQLLGFPTDRSISVIPGDHANYELFIQSTSVNRKLAKGSKVMIWGKSSA